MRHWEFHAPSFVEVRNHRKEKSRPFSRGRILKRLVTGETAQRWKASRCEARARPGPLALASQREASHLGPTFANGVRMHPSRSSVVLPVGPCRAGCAPVN